MLTEEERKNVTKQFTMLQALWVGMLVSLGMFVLLGHMVRRVMMQSMHPGQDLPGAGTLATYLVSTENMVYVVAAVLLVSAYYCRRLILEGRIDASRSYRLRHIKPAFLANYFMANMIPLALMEIVGLSGLALLLSGHGGHHLYILAGLGAAGMFFIRPQRKELETLAGERLWPSVSPPAGS